MEADINAPAPMTRELRINAFGMNCPVHMSPGLWRHPRDQSARYNDLAYWTDLAIKLERGKIDGIFLADVLGSYDIYAGDTRVAIKHGIQVPVNDPLALVPAMATVTKHLGFGVTSILSYDQPFTFARRMSTLDHLSRGRIGWNIVTGYLDSAARAQGDARQRSHDARYEAADDYMVVVYRLWEESWDSDAVIRDRLSGTYTDPGRVHRIDHSGPYYKLSGLHLSEPSPQRTPYLFQAGTSTKGRDFAARHAEAVFLTGPSIKVVAPRVADIRQKAASYGRDPREILVFAQMSASVAHTDEAARVKDEEYRQYTSMEGVLTLIAGFTGIDFSRLPADEPIRYAPNDAIHSALEGLTIADPGKTWTPRGLSEFAALGGIAPRFVGSPATVARAMMAWAEAADIDGFNLAYAVTPDDFTDFVDLVVPELQARRAFKLDYNEGTLRRKLGGRDDLLPRTHPGATYRRRARDGAFPA